MKNTSTSWILNLMFHFFLNQLVFQPFQIYVLIYYNLQLPWTDSEQIQRRSRGMCNLQINLEMSKLKSPSKLDILRPKFSFIKRRTDISKYKIEFSLRQNKFQLKFFLFMTWPQIYCKLVELVSFSKYFQFSFVGLDLKETLARLILNNEDEFCNHLCHLGFFL